VKRVPLILMSLLAATVHAADAGDLVLIVSTIDRELPACGPQDVVRTLPGVQLLHQPAGSMIQRGKATQSNHLAGYV
jgi:hypothetical protein